MPLLTIHNLLTTEQQFQDSTGLSGLATLFVPKSGTLGPVSLTLDQLAKIEPQLLAAATASRITWTVANDPGTGIDPIPDHLATALVTPYNAVAGDQDIITNLTVPGAVSVVLSAAAPIGKRVTVLDGKGDGAANNVTVTVAGGGTIHGTAVISANYGAATFLKTAATVWQRI
jgi:hypothetical protein